MIEEYELIVIGAGPTGIGAAFHAEELGRNDFVVLEGQPEAGGLSASFRDEYGFVWDRGVHLQFSHYDKYDQFLDRVLPSDQWCYHDRKTAAHIGGLFVPYPVQLHLHHLEPGDRWKCVKALLERDSTPRGKPVHFRDWIEQWFGEGIAERFLIPYNEKIWATPLDRMNANWVGERVAVPRLEDILRRICLEEDHTSWGPNSRFRYPLDGGTGAIWRSAAKLLPENSFRSGDPVLEIDAEKKLILTRGGKRYRYHSLVTTVPLPSLLAMLRTEKTLPSVARLEATRTEIVGFGLSGQLSEPLREKIWIYFPDPELSFYRMTLLGNLSPALVPQSSPHSSIMVELASSRFRSLPKEPLLERVERDLRNLDLIGASQSIVSRWHQTLPFGYPVPTVDRTRVLREILPRLEELSIYSRGRFGAWKYEVSNQDHSFMQGVEAVERILHGREELTLFQPDLVNSRRNPFPYPEWSKR